MAALDTFLAQQQAPNVLGAVNRGIATNNLQQLNALKLAQAQQQAPLQNQALQDRVDLSGLNLDNARQNAPLNTQSLQNKLLSQNQNLQLGEQRKQINQQNLEQNISAEEKSRIENLFVLTSDLIGDTTDEGEFESLINSATFLDDEAKQFALQFGAEKIREVGKRLKGQTDKNDRVVKSLINDDGSVVLVRAQSGVQVIPANEVDSEILAQAREFDVETKKQKAQANQLGSDTAKFATDAFKQVANINKNILNLREVIKTVEVDGANTGPLDKRLPSITSAAVKLDNLAGRLGLDVVSATTFGALSESELAFAIDTALPAGLQGPELVKWAKDRINAQEKLAKYLNEAAQFASQPGNTVADFMAKKQAEKDASSAQAQPQAQQQSDFVPSSAQPFSVGRFEVRIKQ